MDDIDLFDYDNVFEDEKPQLCWWLVSSWY